MQRPPWRIVGDSHEVILTTWGDERHVDAVRLDPREAQRLLARVIGPAGWSGGVARGLVEAARYVAQHHGVRLGVRTADPRRLVEAALARGILVGWRLDIRHRGSGGGDGRTADDSDVVAAEDLLRKTWIEIELTDMDGNAMPGERYWIKLPDGTVREGALDQHGRAYFDQLDPGSAEIRWPDRDGDATTGPATLGQGDVRATTGAAALGTRAGTERTWVEIELLDMEGAPVAHERYWIKLPDGSVREGTLDAMGLAFFDDLDPGQCTIRWLGRDEEAAFLEPDATAPGPTDRVAAQVATLVSAARDGSAFCEECERARREAEAESAEAEAEA
ncbi:MAG: hypothetical protein Q8S73_24050 [Deltaproteobacteria bacterium]|nr:hypothetical protein [Myxococcales bacterium]MDP3217206.1 hypothetical protein [Deltaproteobacteria bacterium]